MSMLEELFGVDETEEAEALERVIEGGYDDDDEPAGHADDEAEEERRIVDPQKPPKEKRVSKNPYVLLNAERLTGPRGMHALMDHFKDFKFKGKGHENEDLCVVLKRLEHWAHRLYPKYDFGDCIKKIETLGNKRPVQVTLRKIRSDQLISAEIITQEDSSDDEQLKPVEVDEFDLLLQQQIELAAATPHRTPASAIRTPSHAAPKGTSSPSISEEQKMRMIRNKQLAEQRKRKKNISEQVVDLTGFNQPVTTNSCIHVDLTSPPKTAGHLGESHVIDVTENTGVEKENIAPNLMETDSMNTIDITEDVATSKTDLNGEVRKNTKRLAIIDSSDEEIEDNGYKYIDKNQYSNLPYKNEEAIPHFSSDSSDEEHFVSTVNVSVTADVHKEFSVQNSENLVTNDEIFELSDINSNNKLNSNAEVIPNHDRNEKGNYMNLDFMEIDKSD